MKNRLAVFCTLAGLLMLIGGMSSVHAQPATSEADLYARYPLVPWPKDLQARESAFTLDQETRIALSDPRNEELRTTAAFFARLVRTASVLPMRFSEEPAAGPVENTIAFLLVEDDGNPEEGSYRLEVTPGHVVVTAGSERGLFYGMQTLRQLLPPAAERGLQIDDPEMEWAIPAVEITDAPRFGYRGMHLDVGRHFFPVPFVKKYIDLMALYKFNKFHWHLTEDQGWRIEIEQYPELTEIGSCRDSTMVGHYEAQLYDNAEYCGYYTQEEIKEVVAYAQDRFVTVIPEIEMPGHSSAAIAAYPELGCTDEPVHVKIAWGVHEDIYCPSEETFTFLENVLTEVMALFPGDYIHVGGDEAPKVRWEESALAQRVMEREGLETEEELQSWFIRRIEAFLNAHGRKLIGWDEILQGGLSPNATVMSWRGIEGGIKAAQQGHDAIMTPTSHLYFDYYQADPETEPLAIGGLTTLEKVYGYEPIPEVLTEEEAEHILGAQGNVWTEYIKTPDKVEYMAFPRALALAEVVWSPREAKDWQAFTERLPAQLRRLEALDVDFRVPDFVDIGEIIVYPVPEVGATR